MAVRRGNAITDDDKRRRRSDLLEAAARLLREQGKIPTVADIAIATGLAKGTVHRYFETKDEICVELIEDDFRALFAALDAILDSLPAEGAIAAPALARAYTKTLHSLDTLLPLASLANGVFERNLRIESMRGFKSALAAGLVSAGGKLEGRFASLAVGGRDAAARHLRADARPVAGARLSRTSARERRRTRAEPVRSRFRKRNRAGGGDAMARGAERGVGHRRP